MPEATTAGARYRLLETDRDPYLTRARSSAELTIPTLMPPDGSSGSTKFYTPFQGIGARGINNLASKLLLALMPTTGTFFKLAIDDYALEKLTQQEGMRAEVEEALGKIERSVMTEVETKAMRVSIGEALKQLLVAGNVLLYLSPEGSVKVFRLDRYVVRRDPMGNVLEIVVRETLAPESIPEEIRKRLKGHDKNGTRKTVDLFTRVFLAGKTWSVYQEINGEKVPGTDGTYPKDKSPWIPLRFTKMDGEDYGRGYVEEYYGDLRSLEALTKAIVEGSAAASKVLFLVNPNGTTSERTLTDSPNGAVRSGNAADVTTLQLDKFADFRIAYQTIELIQERLAFAFLLNTAVQRGGERVTAEEIRYMAGELEDALGGVYSILSQDLQYPLVNRIIHQLEKTRKIPTLPAGMVHPSITTGLAAIGRGHDLNKLDAFIGGALQTLGPELVGRYLDVSDYLTRRGTAVGIDTKGLVKTDEDLLAAEERERAAAQEEASASLMNQGGMDMMKEVVKGGMKNV